MAIGRRSGRGKRDAIEHYLDGRSAWKREVFGLLTERGTTVTAAIVVTLALVLPWLPGLDFTIPIWTVLTAILLLFWAALIYLRGRSVRSLAMKHQLHMIAHSIRDKYVRLNSDGQRLDVREISELLCGLIQQYFSILISKHQIGVAIRVASELNGRVAFVTAGRAGLNPNRSTTTEPLFEDQGIAKVFQDPRGRRGVIFINDIDEAANIGAFLRQDNDRNYPADYHTMMVAPINGWNGKGKGILGILYVTSPDSNVFSEKHVDSMGFVCDCLANIYSEIVKTQLTGDSNEKFRFRSPEARV